MTSSREFCLRKRGAMRVLYYSFKHEQQDYGGNVIRKRNYALLQELAGKNNVSFCTYPGSAPRIISRIRNLQRLCGTELFGNRELRAKLKTVELVFIDGTIYGEISTSALKKNRIIAFFHNVEYDYFCQQNRKPNGFLKVLKYYYKKAQVFFYERRICRYADTIITLNERDSDRLRHLYGRGGDLLLPTSMEDACKGQVLPEPDPNAIVKDPYLLFVGSDFFGNTDGLFRFCEGCMPDIRASLVIAGLGMEKYKDKYKDTEYSGKIRFLGYVDDLAQLYRDAAAVVMPIISGSGMKTKTCEAMMYGKVIFGTQESYEGYRLSEDCILCEDNAAFTKKLNDYLNGGIRYFSPANRELFLQNYESSVVAKTFMDYFTGGKKDI